MDEFATMKQLPNQLESLIPKSILQRISKKVTKEAVEDKKIELKQPGTKIPAKDIDVLRLIDTSDLYGLINDGINKYNDRNTVHSFINDMVGNTDVEGNNKATAASKLGKTKPVVVHENNHGNKKLANTGLESNNTLDVHIMKEKEGWFYGLADQYDVLNDYSYTPTKENDPGSSHTFTGDSSIFKPTKIKHNRRLKTRLVSEVHTSVKSNFYIGKRKK